MNRFEYEHSAAIVPLSNDSLLAGGAKVTKAEGSSTVGRSSVVCYSFLFIGTG